MSGRTAEQRLRRLLVMLPWLMERGEVPVAEVAARFEIDEADLIADLELVAMCGLPPYVDEMIDVFVDEGTVFVGIPRLFTRPLRLTREEAFELLVAGRAAMQLPGADAGGALNRGLRKLADALGEDDTGVVVMSVTPDEVRLLTAAIESRRRVRIGYRSADDTDPSDRVVTPFRVRHIDGNWYLWAHDDRREALRTFRVDRIASITDDGDATVDPPEDLDGSEVEWFGDDVPRVLLRLGPGARWVLERYPIDEVSEPDADQWCLARVPVTSERWVARLLMRLGGDAQVIEPERYVGLASSTAAAVLARYDVR